MLKKILKEFIYAFIYFSIILIFNAPYIIYLNLSLSDILIFPVIIYLVTIFLRYFC